MFLLWIAMCGASALCLMRAYLNRQSILAGSAMVIGITVALVTLISWIAWYFGSADGRGWLADSPMFTTDTWTFLLRNAGITFLVTALALRYFYVTHEWRHNVELQARARVHALQARIRPHFLFNSMNTIAALTRSNPGRAEEAVQDLADLFRANLNEKRNEIKLAEEIDVARTYQRMEQLRLGDRLRVDWKIDALPTTAMVPGLILQPLLENAIYHGIEPRPEGGVVTVTGELNKGMITVVVRNPLPAANFITRDGNRLALANIKERLDLMYGDRATVKAGRFDDEYIVTLRFPFTEGSKPAA
jgi:two-component system, LytTR family, sensor histidine kinase AlgZ